MAYGQFKGTIDADTVNKVQDLLLPLDKGEGGSFWIDKAFISIPELEAITTSTRIIVQICTVSHKGQDAVNLEKISSKFEVATDVIKFHLAEASIVNLEDPTIIFELKKLANSKLCCSEKNYFSVIVEGQTTAHAVEYKLHGSYIKNENEDWKFNIF